ncbi:MAG: hypothetical protein WEG56_00730 [Chloroflexota bacterium]
MRPRRSLLVLAVLATVLGGCGGSGGAGDNGEFVEVPGLGATRIDVPRPTTPSREDCSLNLLTDVSLEDRVHGLRPAGLFADRTDATDADLAAEIERSMAETWGEIDHNDPLFELFVAEHDRTRVWWRDLEADVSDGSEVYRSVLEEWAAISVGVFAPTAIEERWASLDGPVTVTFEHGGTAQLLEPDHIEDWIDPRIATTINELIASSGRRFDFVKAFDQTAFVMALTDDERASLASRGWCFE